MKRNYKIFILVVFLILFSNGRVRGQEGGNKILQNSNMSFENSPVYESEITNYTIVANYRGELNYRVFLRHLDTEIVEEITNGYTLNRDGEKPFKVYIFDIKPGEYEIITFAKECNSQGVNSMELKDITINYDDYKVKKFLCVENGEPQINESILNSKPYFENSIMNLNLKTNEYYGDVQYRVFLYSENLKTWTELTKGYSNKVHSTKEYNIKTDKLKLGSYEVSMRVKKSETAGIYKDELGEYDEAKTIKFSIIKNPNGKDTNSNIPESPKITTMYVGNASETTRIMIRQKPNLNSKVIGHIYGSTQEVKVLDKIGEFYYVQVSSYGSSWETKGYIYENYIKKVTPSSLYSIIVDIGKQRVFIYKGKELIKNFICSTGVDNTPTPIGRFLVGDRGHSFGYEKGYICYDYVRINYNYLFHSVLHDLNGRIIQYEYKKLGSKASNGCIRLERDASTWIYKNIPKNTLVEIRK
ncbi:hypothetical protein GCM10008905_23170 [Clostridium malenominatum]|uniref:L,D-TPase catalytic domain-containing protein n=1 Tax=Clostridium malenominatum TaxID=1539 RepID=A0ABN1J271_9CLOT